MEKGQFIQIRYRNIRNAQRLEASTLVSGFNDEELVTFKFESKFICLIISYRKLLF